MSKTYGSDDDVSRKLKISKSRLRAKLSADQPLPPRIQVPSSRVRLWDMDEVDEWLKSFEVREDKNGLGCIVMKKR